MRILLIGEYSNVHWTLACGLRQLGHDRPWLDKQLHSLKLNSPKEVFLLTVDRKGAIYCSPKERKK